MLISVPLLPFALVKKFCTETTSYPTPAPPGNFEDFPDAEGFDEDAYEDKDPPPDPDEGALYSPSDSED
ncbi:hypothetical protein KP509_18G073600 [Ceratopteris richardii]|nr:hypothetical protein KP509_18G073600 [Ceratopteris richardii]